MKAVNKGFTLIELMIVVAIIGVLAAIAVPAYQNYVGKSQFATGLAQLGALKTPIEMSIVDKGSFPADASGIASVNLPAYDNGEVTLKAEDADKGTGTMTFKFDKGTAGIIGKGITLTRAEDGGWTCETTVEKTDFIQGCTSKPADK